MAQMVKAVRMILGMESFGSIPKLPPKSSFDIEIEDDAPKRKPTLEEIDALEVFQWMFSSDFLTIGSQIIKISVHGGWLPYEGLPVKLTICSTQISLYLLLSLFPNRRFALQLSIS